MQFKRVWQRMALLYLIVLPMVESAVGNFTHSQEQILQEIYQVIAHDFHYRRHEWSFGAVRYAGFLQYFGSSWRLVTRLGGTYTVGASAYYNRWNWNSALDISIEFLRDLERYHRVYRHLSWQSDKHLQVEWYRRYPQHWPDAVTFLDFMASYSRRLHNTSGAVTPGYLAVDPHYTDLLRLANKGNAECRSALANATRQLLDLTVRIIGATSQQVDTLLYFSRPRIFSANAAEQLVSIVTEYITLSNLVWDGIPGLLSNYSSAYIVTQDCLNQSSSSTGDNLAGSYNNISKAAASIGRQVLTHVLLYIEHYQGRWTKANANEARWFNLTNEQSASIIDFYCRVLREDVDKDLARHLEAKEMAQLAQLLASCEQTLVTSGTVYSALEVLWRQMRTRISQEYSAFQQYSNRIPAILQAKSVMKVALPIVATFGVCFNSIIILYYARHTQVRRVGRNFLVVLLACFDTCVLIASNIVLFTDKYMEHDQELKPNGGTDLWCKFQAYVLNLTVESSAFVVVILSVERFLAVYSLFRQSAASISARKELPLKKLSILALCVFCFACIFNCMLIIGDEVAAPAKSTVGRQCVHYVRLQNFQANLVFVTLIKPVLNALVRSLLPYSLVCLLNLATCWLLFKKGAYQSLREEEHRLEQQQLQQQDGQLPKALGQLGLALTYLVLTAPAPVIYLLFMTAHADRLIIKLNNGLYDEIDPAFRAHWSRIGQLTVVQYATEYILVPLSASINFFVFYLTDRSFRLYVNSGLRSSRTHRAAGASAGNQEELANSGEGAYASAGQTAEECTEQQSEAL